MYRFIQYVNTNLINIILSQAYLESVHTSRVWLTTAETIMSMADNNQSDVDNSFSHVSTSDNINYSYIMEYNALYGWTGHYYFTYFGQFQRSGSLPVVEAVFICIITTLVICANILVLVIITTTRTGSNGNNYFTCNMSLAAFLYPMGMPPIAVTRLTETWTFSRAACGMVGFTEMCGCIVMVWTMALISIERYRCTQKKRPFRRTQVLVMSAALWVLSIACSVPLGIFFTLKESVVNSEYVIVCTLAWPNNDITISFMFLIPALAVTFVLPLSLLTVNYIRVMKTLNDSMEKFHKQNAAVQSQSPVNSRVLNWKIFRKRKEMKMIRFLILLVVVFCVMWTPMALCFVMLVYDKASYKLVMSSEYFIAAECFALCNSLVNPLIYAFINERYRNGVTKLIAKIRRRRVQPLQSQMEPQVESSTGNGESRFHKNKPQQHPFQQLSQGKASTTAFIEVKPVVTCE